MIKIAGQLAIKTIHGRNGDFNVGRLSTSLCEFTVKNPELEQYKEGKYDGEFFIVEIFPSMYHTAGKMIIELRATLGGMTLSNIDRLSKDEAQQLSPQEVDPIDEEKQPAPKAAAKPSPGGNVEQTVDADLFGTLWPLASVVKLDPTVDRRKFRQQRDRLSEMGYEFEPHSQDWHKAA